MIALLLLVLALIFWRLSFTATDRLIDWLLLLAGVQLWL